MEATTFEGAGSYPRGGWQAHLNPLRLAMREAGGGNKAGGLGRVRTVTPSPSLSWRPVSPATRPGPPVACIAPQLFGWK